VLLSGSEYCPNTTIIKIAEQKAMSVIKNDFALIKAQVGDELICGLARIKYYYYFVNFELSCIYIGTTTNLLKCY
jgi:hypothetical protein